MDAVGSNAGGLFGDRACCVSCGRKNGQVVVGGATDCSHDEMADLAVNAFERSQTIRTQWLTPDCVARRTRGSPNRAVSRLATILHYEAIQCLR